MTEEDQNKLLEEFKVKPLANGQKSHRALDYHSTQFAAERAGSQEEEKKQDPN